MKPQLVGFNRYARTKSCLIAGKYTFDKPVKAKLFKPAVIGLQTDPAVIVKDAGLLSIAVDQLYQLFSVIHHKAVNKFHIIKLTFSRRHMGYVKFSLINKVLGNQTITVFLFKFSQCCRAYREIIGTPVTEQISFSFTASPHPDKVVKERGKTHHGCGRMLLTPCFKPVVQIASCFHVSWIQRHQVFFLPVIGYMIIHGDLFPYPIRHKIHGVLMKRHNIPDCY